MYELTVQQASDLVVELCRAVMDACKKDRATLRERRAVFAVLKALHPDISKAEQQYIYNLSTW